MSDPDERTPLLQGSNESEESAGNLYHQFCRLVGIQPIDQAPTHQHRKRDDDSLYHRVTEHARSQSAMYLFTATTTNTLLLSQVVLGAALTALGASNSNHILITIFGALNTVIAGVIAFVKSRGQPMRARMFRDELDRVVDEIENSATMWLGISAGVHGYNAIETNDQVTVRSEVARLTRLYDKAVKTNTMNEPDVYAAGAPGDPYSAALKSRPDQPALPPPSGPPIPASGAAPSGPTSAPAAAAGPASGDADASPATKVPDPPKPQEPDLPKDEGKEAKTNGETEPSTGKEAASGPSTAGQPKPASSTNAAPAQEPGPAGANVAEPALEAAADADDEPAAAAKPK